MTRFRDLVPIRHHLPTGERNAITDVDGVYVGHTTLIAGDGGLRAGRGPIRTGVTAIRPHAGNIFREKVSAAVYTINGYGKATGFEQVRHLGVIETPICLTSTLNVGKVWDAIVSYSIRENPDIGIQTGTVNPIVGECNDNYLNDGQGRHIQESHVLQAIDRASDRVEEGCVGAGTGTTCYGFKGGIGTASRQVLEGQYTIGVLMQTNFGRTSELQMLGVPVGQYFVDNPSHKTDGSVMMVIATDAPMTSRQLERLAKRSAFGLGRTGTVCHNGSGDFVIAFSTQNRRIHGSTNIANRISLIDEEATVAGRSTVIDELFRAVVECVEESVYNALIAAHTVTGRDGHTYHALPHDKLVELMQYYRRLD